MLPPRHDGIGNDNRAVRRGGEYDPKWDWDPQNRKMAAALTEKGYDVNNVWGIGTHSNKQGDAIMPEMLRWLWRDHPRLDDPKDPSNRGPLRPADATQGADTSAADARRVVLSPLAGEGGQAS